MHMDLRISLVTGGLPIELRGGTNYILAEKLLREIFKKQSWNVHRQEETKKTDFEHIERLEN